MGKQVYIVIRQRYAEDADTPIICGVYDNWEAACKRVSEVLKEDEEYYKESYGEYGDEYFCNYDGEGYAELYINCGWDETRIKATDYTINESTYDLV